MSKTVYIYPSRMSGKSMTCLKRIFDLEAAGYNVVPVYRTPHSNLQGRRSEAGIIDKDILTPEACERAERFLDEMLKSNLD